MRSCWRRWQPSCWPWPATCSCSAWGSTSISSRCSSAWSPVSGYDAYNRYQRVRREKKFIQKAFKNYLSDSLLAEVMKNPAGLNLGGEKKLVTIFFSDLAGFTTLSEKLPPEEVVHILNTYLERMTSVIMDERRLRQQVRGRRHHGLLGGAAGRRSARPPWPCAPPCAARRNCWP